MQLKTIFFLFSIRFPCFCERRLIEAAHEIHFQSPLLEGGLLLCNASFAIPNENAAVTDWAGMDTVGSTGTRNALFLLSGP